MNKIEILKAEKKGITFGKTVFDAIKENKEFGELFSLDLSGDYVEEMVKEVTKDQIVIAFDRERGVFQDVRLRNCGSYTAYKNNEAIDFYVSIAPRVGYTWSNDSIILKNLYIVTDVKAYSEYLLALEEVKKQEVIARLEADIKKTKDNHADMIRLGLKLFEVRQLNAIRKIEKQRGSAVKKEEVRDLLSL